MAGKSITAECDKRKSSRRACERSGLRRSGLQVIILCMPRKSRGHGHDTRYVRMQKNYCFACGQNNPEGMRLKFTFDEERECFVCRFRLGDRKSVV